MTNSNENQEVILVSRLTSTKYLKVSYAICKVFKDPDVSLFLSFLVNMDVYNKSSKQRDKRGFFLATRTFIEEASGITKKRQINVSLKLVEMGLIEVERRGGMPAKIWIKLNHQAINELLDSKSEVIKREATSEPTPIEGYLQEQ